MAIFFTNWLKKNFDKESTTNGKCQESKKCIEMLQIILDGEASEEEQQYFLNHVEECAPCYQYYNLEKTIRLVLKQKIEKKPIPEDLIESIKAKIQHTV